MEEEEREEQKANLDALQESSAFATDYQRRLFVKMHTPIYS